MGTRLDRLEAINLQSSCHIERRDACLLSLGPILDSFTGGSISRLARANHGPCLAARRILLYHPVPKSPTVTLDLPATHHHPHSAAVGPLPLPKHTLLRTQLDYRYAVLSSTYYGTTMETILARVWWSQLALFFSWALAFRPGPSRLPFRARMQLSGSFCSYHSNKLLEALHALQAWPAWLLGHLRREREP